MSTRAHTYQLMGGLQITARKRFRFLQIFAHILVAPQRSPYAGPNYTRPDVRGARDNAPERVPLRPDRLERLCPACCWPESGARHEIKCTQKGTHTHTQSLAHLALSRAQSCAIGFSYCPNVARPGHTQAHLHRCAPGWSILRLAAVTRSRPLVCATGGSRPAQVWRLG